MPNSSMLKWISVFTLDMIASGIELVFARRQAFIIPANRTPLDKRAIKFLNLPIFPLSLNMQEHLNDEVCQEQQETPPIRLHNSPVVRYLYLAAGFAALILAVAGVVLPILPTTPFVLLAAACFARSSKRFHDRLLANRIAGPIIREWTEHRSIPRRVKRWVYFLLAISFGSSILMMPSVWQQVMLAVLGIILVAFIWRIPVRDLPNGS